MWESFYLFFMIQCICRFAHDAGSCCVCQSKDGEKEKQERSEFGLPGPRSVGAPSMLSLQGLLGVFQTEKVPVTCLCHTAAALLTREGVRMSECQSYVFYRLGFVVWNSIYYTRQTFTNIEYRTFLVVILSLSLSAKYSF